MSQSFGTSLSSCHSSIRTSLSSCHSSLRTSIFSCHSSLIISVSSCHSSPRTPLSSCHSSSRMTPYSCRSSLRISLSSCHSSLRTTLILRPAKKSRLFPSSPASCTLMLEVSSMSCVHSRNSGPLTSMYHAFSTLLPKQLRRLSVFVTFLTVLS